MRTMYLEIPNVPYENFTYGEEPTPSRTVIIVYCWMEICAQIIALYAEAF